MPEIFLIIPFIILCCGIFLSFSGQIPTTQTHCKLRKFNKEFPQNLSDAFKYAEIIRLMLFGNDYQVNGVMIDDYNVYIKTYDYSAGDNDKEDELSFPVEYLTLSLAEIQIKDKENNDYLAKQKLKYDERRKNRKIQDLKDNIISNLASIESVKKQLKELTGEDYSCQGVSNDS